MRGPCCYGGNLWFPTRARSAREVAFSACRLWDVQHCNEGVRMRQGGIALQTSTRELFLDTAFSKKPAYCLSLPLHRFAP